MERVEFVVLDRGERFFVLAERIDWRRNNLQQQDFRARLLLDRDLVGYMQTMIKQNVKIGQ